MQTIRMGRSFENVGLRLLFAPICSFTAGKPGRATAQEKGAIRDLSEFLERAMSGLALKGKQQKGYARLGSVVEGIKAEQAYSALQPLLPRDARRARARVGELKAIADEILGGARLSEDERDDLHHFCREALVHLDQQYYESLARPGYTRL